jgi:hypothetical protein
MTTMDGGNAIGLKDQPLPIEKRPPVDSANILGAEELV